MASLQITCINKEPRSNTHEGITHLGGSWGKKTRAQVVTDIDAGYNSYYTFVNGNRAEVGVRQGTNSRYVQTHADGYYNDNLLALPECS